MERIAELVGRILLSHIFLLSGLTKIADYSGTQGYMEAFGVPGSLLPLVIVTEIFGGLSVLLGWKARWGALALAGFSLLAAYFFHMDFSDQAQTINFMKNLAIAGGMLVLAARGAGPWSVDARKRRAV
jgi:putative oxidoreductase